MKKKKLLEDIKSYVWEHPEDEAAFIKLTKVFGLNKVVRGGRNLNRLCL